MILVPFSTFFYLRSYFTELWITDSTAEADLNQLAVDIDTYSGLGAVLSI